MSIMMQTAPETFNISSSDPYDETEISSLYDNSETCDGDYGWIEVGGKGDNMSIESTDQISVSNRRTKIKRAIDEMKKMDPAYNVILTKSGDKKTEFYASCAIPGAIIRDATTGIQYREDRVGSVREGLYFKVSYNGIYGNGQTLFYNGPGEYESHFGVQVDEQLKNEWTEKNRALKRQLGLM